MCTIDWSGYCHGSSLILKGIPGDSICPNIKYVNMGLLNNLDNCIVTVLTNLIVKHDVHKL